MIKDAIITYVPNVRNPAVFSGISLSCILTAVKEGKYRDEVAAVRAIEDTIEYAKAKIKLNSVNFSGTYKKGTSVKNENFDKSSGLFHFDIDKLTVDKMKTVRELLMLHPSVAFLFVSPGKKGFKGGVNVGSRVKTDADYKQIFYQFEKELADKEIVVDDKCKDISRKCFLSDDPNIYVNYEAEVYQLIPGPKTKRLVKPNVKKTQYTIGQVREMLENVPANDAGLWLKFGIILGREFSCSDEAWDLYNEWADKWDGINDNNRFKQMKNAFYKVSQEPCVENPASIGSIIQIAHEYGRANNAKLPALNGGIPDIVFLEQNSKGRILCTADNLRALLSSYKIECRYDVILKDASMEIPWCKEVNDLSREANFQEIRSLAARHGVSPAIADFLPIIFRDSAVNPIYDWVTGKPWDKVSRLKQFYGTLSVGDTTYRDKALFRWLIQCVAAMDGAKHTGNIEAKPKYEMVLVLQGLQGTRKTSWFRLLAPKLYKDYILDGVHLEADNKDSTKKATSSWIVELSELDGIFRVTDIARLKSFLSNTTDIIRLPYDRVESKLQRRTSFCGTVNDDRFLVDATGNRRFTVLPVIGVTDAHNIDMQQLWAEIWLYYVKGEQWWFTNDEEKLQKIANADHESINPIENMLETIFDLTKFNKNTGGDWLNWTEILMLCNVKPDKFTINLLARTLKKIGFNNKRTRKGTSYYLVRHER